MTWLDGKWLCYSTRNKTRLFQINTQTNDKGKLSLQLKRCSGSSTLATVPASFLAFSGSSNDALTLYLLTNSSKQLHCFAVIDAETFDENPKIDLSKQLKGTITHFKVAADGKVFVLADDQHNIAVWSNFEHLLNLPRYEAATTTALALHHALPDEIRVVVAYADSRIVEYDCENAAYTCYFDHAMVVPNTETHCVTDILLDARNPNVFILQNDGYLYTLEKCWADDTQNKNDAAAAVVVSPKKSKRNSVSNAAAKKSRDMSSLKLVFKKPIEHLLQSCWISENNLLTINISESVLLEQLPPVFRQKKYGKM